MKSPEIIPVEVLPHMALRWLADNYEQAQRLRIEVGERIRAVLQGRDESWGWELDKEVDADAMLKAIAAGDEIGPVPMLARSYRRYWTEERETYGDMMSAWRSHPAYEWISRVRGIGPTLGCKLLARLDPEKAPHASSFWAYCGLATVPGDRYRCSVCGLVRGFATGYKVTGKHKRNGSGGNCKGTLERTAGPEDGVRVAQPRATRGKTRSYDAYAKKVMYLVGTSFLKAGGAYEEVYRRHRARLEAERPGWADGRKHLTALRITEKLFLSHLWLVWRAALGLPTNAPYAEAELDHAGMIDPWSMVS